MNMDRRIWGCLWAAEMGVRRGERWGVRGGSLNSRSKYSPSEHRSTHPNTIVSTVLLEELAKYYFFWKAYNQVYYYDYYLQLKLIFWEKWQWFQWKGDTEGVLCALQSLGLFEYYYFLLMDNHSDLTYKTPSNQCWEWLSYLSLAKFSCAMSLRPWWYLFITFLMIYQVTIAILVPWKLPPLNTHLLCAALTARSYCLSCLISSSNLKLSQNVKQ